MTITEAKEIQQRLSQHNPFIRTSDLDRVLAEKANLVLKSHENSKMISDTQEGLF